MEPRASVEAIASDPGHEQRIGRESRLPEAPLQVTGAARGAPFVGRQRELALLRGALESRLHWS